MSRPAIVFGVLAIALGFIIVAGTIATRNNDETGQTGQTSGQAVNPGAKGTNDPEKK